MTALTVYSLNTASSVGGGQKKLVNALASGGTAANVAVTIAKLTGWFELQATAATPGAALAATGTALSSTAPAGAQTHGYLLDDTSLEGSTIDAGTTAAPVVRVLASATTISGKVGVRYWKRSSAGVYTFIGQSVQTTTAAFTTTAANRTLPTMVIASAVSFGIGDKLYVEILVDVTANTANSNSSSISVAIGGTTAGSTNVFPTFGYTALPTPATPTAPTVTAADDSHTILTWPAVTNALSYDIQRGGVTIATGVVGTTYGDSGLSPSTGYTYTVRATNLSGSSAYSSGGSATTTAANLDRGNILASNRDSATALNAATFESETAGAGPSTFWLARDSGWTLAATATVGEVISGSKSLKMTKTGASNTLNDPIQSWADDTIVVAGTSYIFRSDIRPLAGFASTQLMDGYIEWYNGSTFLSASGFTQLAIGRPGSGVYVLTGSATAPATATRARVNFRVTNGLTGDAFSADNVSIHTGTLFGYPVAPAAPSGLVVTSVTDQIVNLGWTAAAGSPDSYEIERNGSSVTTAATGTTYADSGRTQRTPYRYRIRAIKNGAPSAWTSYVDAVSATALGSLSAGEDFTGTDGAVWDATKWTNKAATDGSTPSLLIQGNTGEATTPVLASAAVRALISGVTIADGEILVLIDPRDTQEHYCRVLFRVQDNAYAGSSPSNCYTALWVPGTGRLVIEQRIAGVKIEIGTPAINVPITTTPMWMRVQFSGGDLAATMWADGVPGTTYSTSVNDTQWTTGMVGLSLQGSSGNVAKTTRFDFFRAWNYAAVSSILRPSVRIAGSFVTKPVKIMAGGVFAEKQKKIKIGGVWVNV